MRTSREPKRTRLEARSTLTAGLSASISPCRVAASTDEVDQSSLPLWALSDQRLDWVPKAPSRPVRAGGRPSLAGTRVAWDRSRMDADGSRRPRAPSPVSSRPSGAAAFPPRTRPRGLLSWRRPSLHAGCASGLPSWHVSPRRPSRSSRDPDCQGVSAAFRPPALHRRSLLVARNPRAAEAKGYDVQLQSIPSAIGSSRRSVPVRVAPDADPVPAQRSEPRLQRRLKKSPSSRPSLQSPTLFSRSDLAVRLKSHVCGPRPGGSDVAL